MENSLHLIVPQREVFALASPLLLNHGYIVLSESVVKR
jgi:hypothetical protein